MIDVRHIGPVVLYTCQLPPAATRREAELAAVQSLLCEAFPDGLLLEHAPSGAPVLAGRTERISISHSRSRAALAVCEGAPVGVDTETARGQLARVAPRVLSEAELAEYGSVPGGLLTAWTLKEAIYKAALTPGLDFRRDIRLPLGHKKNEATVAVPGRAARRFAILLCAVDGDEAISVAIATDGMR